ncbi:MAG: histidine kinase, partial [Thiolinea sp.]
MAEALTDTRVVTPPATEAAEVRGKAGSSESVAAAMASRRLRTLIAFPRTVWISLISLSLVFVGIGASWFWFVRIDAIPDWLPVVMSLLWLAAGIGGAALLYWIWREFIRFGDDLTFWATRLRKGDLSVRMPIRKHGCLSIKIRERINAITENYQALSRMQRQRLSRQEKFIAQKKHHLSVLYDVASAINRSDNLDDLLQRFLVTLRDVVSAKAVTVRLVDNEGRMRLVASIGLDEAVMALEDKVPSPQCICARAFSENSIRSHENMRQCRTLIDHPFFQNDDQVRMLAIPL